MRPTLRRKLAEAEHRRRTGQAEAVPDEPPPRLAAFVREAWDILEPGTTYRHGRVIDAIAEHLEAVTAGDITRDPPLLGAAMIAGTTLPQPAGIEHSAEPAGFGLALDGSNRKRMPTPPLPISATLVPGILRTRGVEVSSKRLLAALYAGAIPGRREQWRWILTLEDVDAAEVYFREIAALGATKGGAAAVRQAKARRRLSDAQLAADT